MFNLALAAVSLIGLAIVGWTMYTDYKATPGDGWFTAFRNTMSILGAKISVAAASIAGLLMQDPTIKDTIQTVVPVELWPYVSLVFVGFIWYFRINAFKGEDK